MNKIIYVLKDLSSDKFLAHPSLTKRGVDSLKFAKSFTSILAAERKCAELNEALIKKDKLLGKSPREHFALQLVPMKKWLALGRAKSGAVRQIAPKPVAESALAREARLAVKALAFVYCP